MFSMQDKVVRGFQGAHQLSCHAQVDGYFSTSYNGWDTKISWEIPWTYNQIAPCIDLNHLRHIQSNKGHYYGNYF